jgi:hypothetical protein
MTSVRIEVRDEKNMLGFVYVNETRMKFYPGSIWPDSFEPGSRREALILSDTNWQPLPEKEEGLLCAAALQRAFPDCVIVLEMGLPYFVANNCPWGDPHFESTDELDERTHVPIGARGRAARAAAVAPDDPMAAFLRCARPIRAARIVLNDADDAVESIECEVPDLEALDGVLRQGFDPQGPGGPTYFRVTEDFYYSTMLTKNGVMLSITELTRRKRICSPC